MNYLDRKFGTGWPKYGAMIFLTIIGIALLLWNWLVGSIWFVFFGLVFYSQRNTK